MRSHILHRALALFAALTLTMSLAVSASADTPSSGTVSHPDTDYDLGSATLHGQTWVGGETYGGDPNHNCTFHTETCDTEELWDCLHGGVRFLVCRTCGKKYVSARMKPQPHNYAIQVDASGNCTMTCTRCGDTCTQKLTQKNPDRYSMSLQINGFTFVHGEEYGGDPNHGCNLQSPSVPSGAATVWDCPNGGVSLIICADCHKIYVGAILGPIEHSYQEEVVTPATATAPGLKTFTCSNCGDSYSETIPQLSGSAPAVPETPESSVTRDPSATAAVSTNVNAQNYTVWSQPVTSYLYARQDGNLTRVEALSDGVAVEIYDSSYHLLSSRKIPMELSLFGGFFAGKNYNFLIFGQSNPDENDRQEVVRVVRYSKDWERQSQCSMYGADTTIPFEDGSLRCAESQGMLYILTCHKHYKSEDGLNHQSNMTVEIRQSDMTITDQFYEVDNPGSGYVSHSFNQFILVDQENRLVTLNHGDAYPRSAAVHQYQNQASEEKFFGYYGTKMDPGLEFAGGTGLNATGASVGGLASSGDCYLAVCNTIIQDSQYKSRKTRNVVLTVTDKTTMGSRGTVQLTNYPEGSPESASTPQIVPITDNRFLVLWNIMSSNQSSIPRPRHEIGYVFINGQGQPQGAVQTAAANLSDCQPILVNGQVIWYVTNHSIPVFYSIDAQSGTLTKTVSNLPETTFPDVADNHWARPDIAAALGNGLVQGYPDGNFHPSDTMTNAQFCTIIARQFCSEDLEEYSSYASEAWWKPAMISVLYHGWLSDTTLLSEYNQRDDFGPQVDAGISRYDMAQIMYNMIFYGSCALPTDAQIQEARNAIGDWASIPENYRAAVSTCYALDLIKGTDLGIFDGDSVMTRAQACAVAMRLADTVITN